MNRKWGCGVSEYRQLFCEICCERRDWAVAPRGWKSQWIFLFFFFFFKMGETFWKIEKNIWGHLPTLHPSLRLSKSPVEQNYLMAHTLTCQTSKPSPLSATSMWWESYFPLIFPFPPSLFQISLGSQIRKTLCSQVLFCRHSPGPPHWACSIEVNGIPASLGPVESQGDLLCEVLPVETDLFFNDLHLYPQDHFSKDSHEWTN